MGEFAPRPKLAAVVPQDIEAWFEGAFGWRARRGGIVGLVPSHFLALGGFRASRLANQT